MKFHNYSLHNFFAMLYRLQIKIGQFLLGADVPILICAPKYLSYSFWKKYGLSHVSFAYKEDEIFWLHDKKQWLSLCCGGVFNTLEDIDNFWREYEEACAQKEITFDDLKTFTKQQNNI